MGNWSSSSWQKPIHWEQIRKRILRRDQNRCQWVDSYGRSCVNLATDVDHIVQGAGEDDSNLRALCAAHHKLRSSRQGAIAANKKRQDIKTRFTFGRETDPRLKP